MAAWAPVQLLRQAHAGVAAVATFFTFVLRWPDDGAAPAASDTSAAASAALRLPATQGASAGFATGLKKFSSVFIGLRCKVTYVAAHIHNLAKAIAVYNLLWLLASPCVSASRGICYSECSGLQQGQSWNEDSNTNILERGE